MSHDSVIQMLVARGLYALLSAEELGAHEVYVEQLCITAGSGTLPLFVL